MENSAASVVFSALTSDGPRFHEGEEIRSRVGTSHIDILLGGQWHRLTVTHAEANREARTIIETTGDLFAILLGEIREQFDPGTDIWPPDRKTIRLRVGDQHLLLTLTAIDEPISMAEHRAETAPAK